VESLGKKRTKNKKLVYGLVILVSSIILIFSLWIALSPIVTSQEANMASTSSISTDDEAINSVCLVTSIQENNGQ
jgi:heme/copper-type cytochrome/quinol oxidase subunit 3